MLKCEWVRADHGERRSAARAEARLCLHPRNAMTTQTYEAPTSERTHQIHTPRREEPQHRKREEKSELASFSEAERAPKALVAFEEPPVPAALRQTW
jgi:hypothetical protein